FILLVAAAVFHLNILQLLSHLRPDTRRNRLLDDESSNTQLKRGSELGKIGERGSAQEHPRLKMLKIRFYSGGRTKTRYATMSPFG
ncbi:MAG: hypothetical protein OER92_10720, partial [Alphaproteobacteria bacterium]|nr:hypothetical protein [Alphaproteobacteria bacterium]